MESKSTGLKALLIAMLVIVIAGAAVSSTTLVLFLTRSDAKAEESGTKENDVTIAGSYVIRSTEHISDAYKNGTRDSLGDKDKETLDMAVAAMDEFLKEGMTDFEKEKACYEWITKTLGQDRGLLTVIPSSGADSDNPYGALKYHNAVCVGYATTFRLFMQMMDIPCIVVHESGLYHSWDMVQLDGDWYHVDCYSGANSGTYQFFNMTDTMIGQSYDQTYFPSATSLKYNVGAMEAVSCDDIFEIPAILRTALDDKETMISLKFPKDLKESEAQLANNMVSEIESLLWSLDDFSGSYMVWNWYPNPENNLYIINITYGGHEDDNITEEQQEQATEAVSEAFSDLTDAEISVDGDEEVIYEEAVASN